ncbi:MAG: AAA domain-containing protein [bacterium]|nr:AAA domain-containing protein [bacterium]
MSPVASTDPLPTPEELEPAVALATRTLESLDRVLLGREDFHRLVMVGILSRGHILLEGVPGVGKTALIKALGQILGLEFNRVQFTPDLMPGDILGSHILQETVGGQREMTFQPGPVFTQILLADEINRASPKTQSALLEAMQERSVTLLGTTRELPDPFFVLASQNPIELEGTYPLPEAQLDRFLFKLVVDDPGPEVLEQIISTRRRGEPPPPERTLSAAELGELFAMMNRIFLPQPVSAYIARLVAASHSGAAEAPDQVREYVSYGASPRAAIAMAEAGRAHALLAGRPTVGFDDVQAVVLPVLRHRLILNYRARFDGVDAATVTGALLSGLDETGIDLPAGVEVAR